MIAGMENARLHAPATLRNRDPLLAVLRPLLPGAGLVLEVASGTGEHVAHFAGALPGLLFQPTDPDADNRASIDAWTEGLANVRPALALDTASASWPVARADAVLCINMVHISPWPATEGLVAGSARVLPSGRLLVLYGAFKRDDRHTAQSNAEFDADLRARDPAWGVRDLETVAALAEAAGFGAPEVVEMPANNLLVAFRRKS